MDLCTETRLPKAPGDRRADHHLTSRSRLRLAVLCDFPEENWPSMDLCAEMLLAQTKSCGVEDLETTRVCPPFRRVLGRVPWLVGPWTAYNGDRVLNRHWCFPRHLRRCRAGFDAYHICDHSYAQLAHLLPGARTGVLCHDADAFRCLVAPRSDRRPVWFRRMMRYVLSGLQRAAVVFHTTDAVKADLLRFGLVAEEKLVLAPLGYAPEFSPAPRPDLDADRILAALADKPFLMHVGSCIPRKRVDFLLNVFANLKRQLPDLCLVKVGGTWSDEHLHLIRQLGLTSSIRHVHGVSRSTLAALYRKTDLLMIPSESEGFGLPALEGLACGATVLVSDLSVFREVGGEALLYAPPLDLQAWREVASQALARMPLVPPLATRLMQASRFSWKEHARIVLGTYRKLIA